jgi:hypothetical protein
VNERSERTRPPDHPLVELMHDVRSVITTGSTDARAPAGRAELYERVRQASRAARRALFAIERLVDELEAESMARADRPNDTKDGSDGDIKHITIR